MVRRPSASWIEAQETTLIANKTKTQWTCRIAYANGAWTWAERGPWGSCCFIGCLKGWYERYKQSLARRMQIIENWAKRAQSSTSKYGIWRNQLLLLHALTHWGTVMRMGQRNGSSLVQITACRTKAIRTNVDLLTIGPLATDFSRIWYKILSLLKKILSFAKHRPYCYGLNTLH